MRRNADPLFQSGSVRVAGETLGFVYKAAAEIGELGDNIRALRAAITDRRAAARRAVAAPARGWRCSATPAGRASGSSASRTATRSTATRSPAGRSGPYSVAVLNGDVDNHADLKVAHDLSIDAPITTDAKVIPVVMGRHALATGDDVAEAFRRTVAEFEGSVAIGAASAERPDQVHLALRGSGQGMYVGLAEDLYIVASEPYGVVEETSHYLRMDGEGLSPSGSRGQVLDARRRAGRRGDRRRAPGLRRHRAAGHRRRRRHRAGHHARHRSRRLAALPAQGDPAGAGQLRQDAARQDRRRSTACCRPSVGDARRCRPTSPAGWRRGRSSGCG